MNSKNSTLIISFLNKETQEFSILIDTFYHEKELYLLTISKRSCEKFDNVFMKWDDIIEKYSFFSINWNPSLYLCHKKIEAEINSERKYRKFAIRIPPSKADSEVGVLVERHLIGNVDPN